MYAQTHFIAKTTGSSSGERQSSIKASFAQSQPYNCKGKRWEEFDSQYELPGCNYMSRIAVPELYANTKERVTKQLIKAAYFASTTDM